MGCYEDAMKRLHEAANRLSPKRQTGSIRRREEEIKRLEREASASEEIREQTRKFSERHQGALREAQRESVRSETGSSGRWNSAERRPPGRHPSFRAGSSPGKKWRNA